MPAPQGNLKKNDLLLLTGINDWLAKLDAIAALQQQIVETTEYANSWTLSAKSMLGLGVQNVEEDKHLLVLPNSALSKEDLTRKIDLLKSNLVVLQDFSKDEFVDLLGLIPGGFKGIKFLYDANELARLKYFLHKLHDFTEQQADDDLIDLMVDILVDVKLASRRLAISKLEQHEGFASLPTAVQEQLIEQQAFVDQLNFDLEYITGDSKSNALAELKTYSQKLQGNITNAIANNNSFASNAQNFDAIVSDVRTHEQAIRSDLFRRNLTDENSKYALGAGLGLAWLLGAPALMAGAAAGIAAVAKATYESNNAELPEVEDEIKFASSILPDDYKFLQAEDRYWGVHKDLTIDNITVINGNLADQFKDKLQQVQDDLKQKALAKGDELSRTIQDEIESNVTQPISQKKKSFFNRVALLSKAATSSVKLFLGVQTLFALALGLAAIIMVATGVAAPPLWPLLIGTALGLLGGVVIGIVKALVAPEVPAQKIIDKIIDIVYLPARPFVALAKFITVDPIKSIINTFETGREKQGYAVVAVSIVLAVAAGVALPFIAPGMGIFAAALVGGLTGAFIGLRVGAFVRDFQIYRDKQAAKKAAAVTPESNEEEVEPEIAPKPKSFTISAEAIAALDKMSAGLSGKLAHHFQDREQEIRSRIAAAIAANDQGAAAHIKYDLDTLEKDWDVILLSSNDPRLFCEVVGQYLSNQYATERNKYIAMAQQKKDTLATTAADHIEPAVIQERRASMRFSNTPNFKMDFAVDVVAERKKLVELREMEESIRGIKTSL